MRSMVVFLFWILASRSAFAQPGQRDFLAGFTSPRFQVLDTDEPPASQPGRFPRAIRWFLTELLGREPDSSPREFRAGCRPDDLENELVRTRMASRQAAAVEAHFRRCQPETGVRDRFFNSFDTLRLRLDVPTHPFISRVVMPMPDGTKLRGLLALKGDRLRRPFVVVRLGIFSNVEEFLAERYLLMQLFEQGPSNVLIVENVTGSDFVASNPGFSIGGAVEGLQNLHLARRLRDPAEPLAALVGSLHFVGISLGGNGLFSTAALDPLQAGGPRIDSFTALCPVVHLKKTLDAAARPGPEGATMDAWVAMRLSGLEERMPTPAGGHWTDWLLGRTWFLNDALKVAQKTFAAAPQPGLATGLTLPKDWSRDLWVASEPWPWYRGLKAPVLVIATRADDLVRIETNALDYEEMMKGRRENTALVLMNEGFHCTLPIAYDWNTIAAVLNGVVRASDSSWRPRHEVLEMDLGDVLDGKAAGATKLSYGIEWPDKGGFVALKVKADSGDSKADFSMSLPVSGFDFKIHDPELNGPGRRMIERWLHRNLRLELMPKGEGAVLRMSWPRAGS